RQAHGPGRRCRAPPHHHPARRPVGGQGPGIRGGYEEDGPLHPGRVLMTTPDRLPLESFASLAVPFPATGDGSAGDLVDQLLAEQRSLTAVERFSLRHEGGTEAAFVVENKSFYRDLIPLRAPGAGEQYAFEVD